MPHLVGRCPAAPRRSRFALATYGPGNCTNGKGTIYKALLRALGDYADTVDPDLFMVRDNAHSTGEMDLRGLRLGAMSKSDRDRRLAEATMKRHRRRHNQGAADAAGLRLV